MWGSELQPCGWGSGQRGAAGGCTAAPHRRTGRHLHPACGTGAPRGRVQLASNPACPGPHGKAWRSCNVPASSPPHFPSPVWARFAAWTDSMCFEIRASRISSCASGVCFMSAPGALPAGGHAQADRSPAAPWRTASAPRATTPGTTSERASAGPARIAPVFARQPGGAGNAQLNVLRSTV